MKEQPLPKSLKNLKGCFGLACYYRNFIKDYGTIATPLTTISKKDIFTQSQIATMAFNKFKQAMFSTPVLATLDLNKPFV